MVDIFRLHRVMKGGDIMDTITIETKTNGYQALTLQPMIARFEKVAVQFFPGCTVRHFYYGDHLDMADIILDDGDYGYFNITADRVSLNSHACSTDEIWHKFQSMTHNDECFAGKLIELSEEATS